MYSTACRILTSLSYIIYKYLRGSLAYVRRCIYTLLKTPIASFSTTTKGKLFEDIEQTLVKIYFREREKREEEDEERNRVKSKEEGKN